MGTQALNQRGFWESLVNKYQRRNVELEQRENEIRARLLPPGEPDASESRASSSSEAQTSPSASHHDADTLSVPSLTSTDLQFMLKIQQLVEHEKELKQKIEDLQKREETYKTTLKQADELFAQKEDLLKSCLCKVQEDEAELKNKYTKVNEELMLENKRLTDDLMDLKLEMKHCIEKLEGPISRQMEREKLKNQELEEECAKMAQNSWQLQQMCMEQTGTLKSQFQEACKNLCQLNSTNLKLKEELCTLRCKCDELEEELVRQKIQEAETLKKVMEKKENETKCVCDCPCAKKKRGASGDEDTLFAIGRRLSNALLEADACVCCKCTIPPNLKDTFKGIKDIVDLVDKRGSSISDSAGPEVPPDEPPPKDEEPSACDECNKEAQAQGPDVETAEQQTEHELVKEEAIDENPENVEQEVKEPSKAKEEDKVPSIAEEIDKEPSTAQEGEKEPFKAEEEKEPSKAEEEDKEPSKAGEEYEEPSKAEEEDKEPSKTEEEDKEPSKAEEEDKEPSKTEEEEDKEPSKAEEERQTEADVVAVPISTSATKTVDTDKPLVQDVAAPELDEQGTKAPASASPLQQSKQSLGEPCDLVCSKTTPSSVQKPPETTAVVPAAAAGLVQGKDEEQEEEIEVHIEMEGGSEAYVEVDAEFRVTDKSGEDIHVTTTITDSGTLEVITEGPAGIIETTMIYTDSGHIEVLTEITEYDEEEKPEALEPIAIKAIEGPTTKAIVSGTSEEEPFFRKGASEIEPGGKEQEVEVGMTLEIIELEGVAGGHPLASKAEEISARAKDDLLQVASDKDIIDERKLEQESELLKSSGQTPEVQHEDQVEALQPADVKDEEQETLPEATKTEHDRKTVEDKQMRDIPAEIPTGEKYVIDERKPEQQSDLVKRSSQTPEVQQERQVESLTPADIKDDAQEQLVEATKTEQIYTGDKKSVEDIPTDSPTIQEDKLKQESELLKSSVQTAEDQQKEKIEALQSLDIKDEEQEKLREAIETKQPYDKTSVEGEQRKHIPAEMPSNEDAVTAKEHLKQESELLKDSVPTPKGQKEGQTEALQSTKIESEEQEKPAEVEQRKDVPTKMPTEFPLEQLDKLAPEYEEQGPKSSETIKETPAPSDERHDIDTHLEPEKKSKKEDEFPSKEEAVDKGDDKAVAREGKSKAVEAALDEETVMQDVEASHKVIDKLQAHEELQKEDGNLDADIAVTREKEQLHVEVAVSAEPETTDISVPQAKHVDKIVIKAKAVEAVLDDETVMQDVKEPLKEMEEHLQVAIAVSVEPERHSTTTDTDQPPLVTEVTVTAETASPEKELEHPTADDMQEDTVIADKTRPQAKSDRTVVPDEVMPETESLKSAVECTDHTKHECKAASADIKECKAVCAKEPEDAIVQKGLTDTKSKEPAEDKVPLTTIDRSEPTEPTEVDNKSDDEFPATSEYDETRTPAFKPDITESDIDQELLETVPAEETAATVTVVEHVESDEILQSQQTDEIKIPAQETPVTVAFEADDHIKAEIEIVESKDDETDESSSDMKAATTEDKSSTEEVTVDVTVEDEQAEIEVEIEVERESDAPKAPSLVVITVDEVETKGDTEGELVKEKPGPTEEVPAETKSEDIEDELLREEPKAPSLVIITIDKIEPKDDTEGDLIEKEPEMFKKKPKDTEDTLLYDAPKDDKGDLAKEEPKPEEAPTERKSKDIEDALLGHEPKAALGLGIITTDVTEPKVGIKSDLPKEDSEIIEDKDDTVGELVKEEPEAIEERLSKGKSEDIEESLLRDEPKALSSDQIEPKYDTEHDLVKEEPEAAEQLPVKKKSEDIEDALLDTERPQTVTDAGEASGDIFKGHKQESKEALSDISLTHKSLSSESEKVSSSGERAPQEKKKEKGGEEMEQKSLSSGSSGSRHRRSSRTLTSKEPLRQEAASEDKTKPTEDVAKDLVEPGISKREKPEDCTCMPDCDCKKCALVPDTRKSRDEAVRPTITMEKAKTELPHPPDCYCVSCLCDPCFTATPKPIAENKTQMSFDQKIADKPHITRTENKRHPPNCYCIDCLCDVCPDVDEQQHGATCQTDVDKSKTYQRRHSPATHFPARSTSDFICKAPCVKGQMLHNEDCYCPKCVCPGADLIPPEKKHGPKCDCEVCRCENCPGGMSQPKEADELIDVSDKEDVKEEITDDKLQNLSAEMENEDEKHKSEMDELRDLMQQIKCACAKAESQAIFGAPGGQATNKEAAMSELQLALANLQEKCRAKDQMIEALTQELKMRATSKVFNDLLKNLVAYPIPTVDYDRTEICATLPRPIESPAFGKPSHRVQKCLHPNFPNCPCAITDEQPTSEMRGGCDHVDFPNCPCNPQVAMAPLQPKRAMNPPMQACSCDDPPKTPPMMKNQTPCNHPHFPNCPCNTTNSMKPQPAVVPVAPPLPVGDSQFASKPNSVCPCPQGGIAVNPAPLEITHVRQVAADSLLMKWKAPSSNLVTGYEIEIDGVLKSRVHSVERTSAIVHTVQFKGALGINLFAVTRHGRCLPPATAVFQC